MKLESFLKEIAMQQARIVVSDIEELLPPNATITNVNLPLPLPTPLSMGVQQQMVPPATERLIEAIENVLCERAFGLTSDVAMSTTVQVTEFRDGSLSFGLIQSEEGIIKTIGHTYTPTNVAAESDRQMKHLSDSFLHMAHTAGVTQLPALTIDTLK